MYKIEHYVNRDSIVNHIDNLIAICDPTAIPVSVLTGLKDFVNSLSLAAPTAVKINPDDPTHCPHCKQDWMKMTKNPASFFYCPACGTKLVPSWVVTNEGEELPSRKEAFIKSIDESIALWDGQGE